MIMPRRFEEGAADDFKALSQLHSACFDEGWSPESLATLLRSGSFAYVSGTEALFGFILVRCVADEAEILTLAVLPEQRRRGIARTLVEAAARDAAKAGAKMLYLEVSRENAPARALYEGSGFFLLGTRPRYYSRHGMPPDDALTLGARLPLPMGKAGGIG